MNLQMLKLAEVVTQWSHNVFRQEQIPGAMPVLMGNMKIKEHVSDDEPLCFQKSQDTMLDAIKSHHGLPLDNSEVLVQQEVLVYYSA